MQEQVIARAMKDDAFRQQLLSNPKAVLERELGITLPQGVSVQVHEDTPTIIHLVLPMKAPTGEPIELSDEELEQTVGGQQRLTVGVTGCQTYYVPCTPGGIRGT